jgi:pyruvate formate lyase activating enzyme
VQWVKENLGPGTPVHFSRFHPQYKLADAKTTPVKTLEKAVNIAEKLGMHYAYLGNVPGHGKENTYCPKCGAPVIRREGNGIEPGEECAKCKTKIELRGLEWVK